MGVPYSKQIDLAFDQVGPFLQTAKYIFYLFGVFHVFATLILGLLLGSILLALVALLISINPDLDAERRAIVTPVLRRITWLVVRRGDAYAREMGRQPRAEPDHGRWDRSEKRK